MSSEVSTKADFSHIRYAQCWEDADVLLEALDIQPEDICLSVASAGDNTLAMVSRGPKRVIALDLSEAQLACLALRVAAYRCLSHPELLELIGSSQSDRRLVLYERCRTELSAEILAFWDAQPTLVAEGVGNVGKFERYLALFRRYVLPLTHSQADIKSMVTKKSETERYHFYEQTWNNWRWRVIFRLFFSRFVMGRLGRDPTFFNYVEGSVAERILERTQYALTTLDPSENPYLQWIVTGHHPQALPYSLRPENFEAIRANLECLEWHQQSVEAFVNSIDVTIDRFNLSDIFEYMSLENYHWFLEQLIRVSGSGSRLVYWNMLAPRRRPASFADQLKTLDTLAERLYKQDKAFFYSDFVVEEVI